MSKELSKIRISRGRLKLERALGIYYVHYVHGRGVY